MKFKNSIIGLMTSLALLSACKKDGKDYTFVYLDLREKIVINEVYTYGAEDRKDDLDYIELFNLTNEEIDLSRLQIWENGGIEEAFTIPDGIKIAPRGYWVLQCDKTMIDPHKAYFGLSKNYDQVFLSDCEGVMIDRVETPNMIENEIFGRETDGANHWVVFTQKTSGLSNNGAPIKTGFVRSLPLYINEVFIIDRDAPNKDGYDDPEFSTLHPDELADWVEIYNDGDVAFDLTGFLLDDDASAIKTPGEKGATFVFSNGTQIPAKGILVVNFDKDNTDGSKATMGLGKSGDRMTLSRPMPNGSKVVIDDVVIPAFYDNKQAKVATLNKTDGKYYKATECDYQRSYGRGTNGSDVMGKLHPFTKGSSNHTAQVVVGGLMVEVPAP